MTSFSNDILSFCHFSNDAVLSKLVTSLKEADQLSNEQELGFLQNLLESKEINALVNVHTKVAKVTKDEKLAPIMSSSMQVALEVLDQLSQRCHTSELCKELFYLLQKPHMQVIAASLPSTWNWANIFLLAFVLCFYRVYCLHTMPSHRKTFIRICLKYQLRLTKTKKLLKLFNLLKAMNHW